MKEIITLQFGNYSNWIGTQFWNLNVKKAIEQWESQFNTYSSSPFNNQKPPFNSPDEDLSNLYRFSNSKTTPPTPRALIFDTKGMVDLNHFSDTQPDKFVAWDKNPDLYIQNRIDSNNQLNWSDIDKNSYNINSNLGLNQLQQNDQLKPMSSYFQGKEIMNQFEKEVQMIDNNLRFFTEECDYLQGFLTFTNAFDGFSGFSSSYLDLIRDEYPKSSIINLISMSCPESLNSKAHSYSIINQGMVLGDNHSLFDIRIPLFWDKCQSIVNINQTPHHMSSSVMALAIDTMLLRTRMKNRFLSLADISLIVNPSGHRPVGDLKFKGSIFANQAELVSLSNPEFSSENIEYPTTQFGQINANTLITHRFINTVNYSNDDDGVNQLSKIQDDTFEDLWRDKINLDIEKPIETILNSQNNESAWMNQLYQNFKRAHTSTIFSNEDQESMEEVMEDLASWCSLKNNSESDYDE